MAFFDTEKITELAHSVCSVKLPAWEEIPSFGLYMEQVITLMNEYVGDNGEQTVTASAINNYVRKKIMPEPVKKKYYRLHIASLIMICTLKESLSLAALEGIMDPNAGEEEIKAAYEEHRRFYNLCQENFEETVREFAASDAPASIFAISAGIEGRFARRLFEGRDKK